MGDVLVVLAAILAAALVLAGVTLGLLLWRLRRRNRLHPSTPTAAPVTWLLSPARPARLHRRLRAAVLTAHFRAPGRGRRKVAASAVDELVADLLRQAVAVDHQLVVAARAPWRVRTRLLDVVEPQVATLEQLAARLAVLGSASTSPGGAPAAAAIDALEERLDALEAARREIADLEAMLRVARAPRATLPHDDRA